MDPTELRKREDMTLLIAKVIAFAFAAVVFVYPLVVVALVGEQYLGPGLHGVSRTFAYLVMGAALLLLVVAPRAGRIPMDMARKKIHENFNPGALLSAWLLSIIVAFALRDLAATLGLVLSLITRNLFWCVLLGFLALISMGRNWPTRERMEEFLRRAG